MPISGQSVIIVNYFTIEVENSDKNFFARFDNSLQVEAMVERLRHDEVQNAFCT